MRICRYSELVGKRPLHHQCSCPTVAQHLHAVRPSQTGVDRHRNCTDLDRAPENGSKLYAVIQTEQNPLLHLYSRLAQYLSSLVDAVVEFPVGVGAVIVDQGKAIATPFVNIAVYELHRCVVAARYLNSWRVCRNIDPGPSL